MENKNQVIEKELEVFFRDPKIARKDDTTIKLSTLYRLMRDMYRCMGYTENVTLNDTEQKLVINTEPILWPAAMVALAGIDLLGKFYAGDDGSSRRRSSSRRRGNVTKRFTDYCEKYMHLNEENAEVIYQFRNSLLHSYGLLSKKKINNYEEITYYFLASSYPKDKDNIELVKLLDCKTLEKSYRIDLIVLLQKFEKSIKDYREDLEKDEDLKEKFHKMFKIYGMTHPEDTYLDQLKRNEVNELNEPTT